MATVWGSADEQQLRLAMQQRDRDQIRELMQKRADAAKAAAEPAGPPAARAPAPPPLGRQLSPAEAGKDLLRGSLGSSSGTSGGPPPAQSPEVQQLTAKGGCDLKDEMSDLEGPVLGCIDAELCN